MQTDTERLPTESVPVCPLCNREGPIKHTGLRDLLFKLPGDWTLRWCRHCEILWLDPRPTIAAMAIVYSSYHTHESVEVPNSPLQERLRKAALSVTLGYPNGGGRRLSPVLGRFVARLPGAEERARASVMGLSYTSPRARLLDVGSGNGFILSKMQSLGWTCEGVEPDPKAAAQARAQFGITVHEGTLDTVQLPPGSYDAVTMSHVIEHVSNPLELFKQSWDLLRPGGTLSVTTPNATALGHSRFGPHWRGLEPPRHLIIFSPGALRDLARAAGFAEVTAPTLARSAGGLYLQSADLKRQGTGSKQTLARLAAVVFYLKELALRRRKPVGEEILMVATKA